MEMNFCRRCGEPLHHKDDNVYECVNRHTMFAEPAPTVGVFFVSADSQMVLLATRGVEPNKGMLDSLGGFLKPNESFEQAGVRELQEEVGIRATDYEPLTYLSSHPSDYLYQKELVPLVSAFFWTKLKSDVPLRAADDVASVEWYDIAAIDFAQMASDDIRDAIRALQKTLNRQGGKK